MAFVSSGSPEQDPNAQNGQNPLAQQAPVTSAPNAGGAGKAAAQPSNTSQAQPFANLSTYLTANAPQIGQMGDTIAGNLNTQYTGATNAIDSASQNFGKDVNAGYTPNDPNVISSVQTSPTAVAADPTQAKSFTGMYNDSYTGPSTFQDSSYYSPLSSQVQAGQQAASQVKTVPGLQSYLSADKPGYTQGQSTLDSVLLNGNPDAVGKIQTAAKQFDALPGYLTSAVTSGNTAAQTAQQQAQAARDAARTAFQTSQGNVVGRINSEEAAAVKQAQDYNAQVQAAQGKVASDVPLGNGLKDIMAQYGATFGGASAPWLDGTKIGIPNQVIGMPNANAVASGTDYSDIAALEQLSGGPFSAPIDPAQAAKAGTYQAPGAVDQSSLTNALKAMQDFVLSPNGNNIHVGSSGNVQPFTTAANQWYNQLIGELGYQYPGTGSRPAPFSAGTSSGGGFVPGGV